MSGQKQDFGASASSVNAGKLFRVEYADQPHRNRAFMVRGICKHDVLNPCWDNRPSDVPGEHWGGGPACGPCAEASRVQS